LHISDGGDNGKQRARSPFHKELMIASLGKLDVF